MKVLSFGEIIWDVYPEKQCIGGAPLNFAAHFVKCGGSASLVSAVGNDELGREAIKQIKSLNVDTKHITVNEKPTGRCMVTLDENSVPTYTILEDTSYDYAEVPKTNESDYNVLYFGTLALRGSSNKKVLEEIIHNNRFNEVFADINIRKPFISKESAEFALKNASILKVSDEELPTLSKLIGQNYADEGDFAKALCARFSNLKIVIVTLGKDGSLAYEKGTETITKAPACKVNVVSTVGAGDSFSAAFLSRYLSNEPISECLEFASKISGFVVSKKEAIPDYDF